VDLHNYSQAFRRAYEQAAVYALVVIFLLVLADLRRPTHAVLAMTPLFVGAGWTVGLMWVFGVHFNLANVIFLPLIVGAGVENGILILHRWRESRTGFMGIPTSTGRGVALASLTTVVGFGSLMIARHRGVQSLGLLLALGTVCVLVASFTVLPGLLGLLARRRRAPAPAPRSWAPSGPQPIGIDGRARRAARGEGGPGA
jgi:predicted RND superfamily exporter protein